MDAGLKLNDLAELWGQLKPQPNPWDHLIGRVGFITSEYCQEGAGYVCRPPSGIDLIDTAWPDDARPFVFMHPKTWHDIAAAAVGPLRSVAFMVNGSARLQQEVAAFLFYTEQQKAKADGREFPDPPPLRLTGW